MDALERLDLLDKINENLDRFFAKGQGQIVDALERLDILDEINNSLDRFFGKIVNTVKTLLERFLSGEFLNNTVLKFLQVCKDVFAELGGNTPETAEVIVKYCEARQKDIITESAYKQTQQIEITLTTAEAVTAFIQSLPIGYKIATIKRD